MTNLFGIAILPGIVLMIYIYIKDRHEKEPISLLIGCFVLGIISVIPAAIIEEIVIGDNEPYDLMELLLQCVLVIGVAEELSKFVFMFVISWWNKNYNFTFDGIVYSVFVSLGFATIENILYVLNYGFGTGILRALTSVPGHMCFAVIMGYFYSKMRLALKYKNTGKFISNLLLAIIIPVIVHGLYDTIAMSGTLLSFFLFIIFVIVMYICCFLLVNKASKTDHLIIVTSNMASSTEGTWYCPRCGLYNHTNFCIRCGYRKPLLK